ncbi:predicted protein [Lichtheimia corymbifera JMRC:FSU:9682]|uniref:Uncharacterized protein n=1 Tax=Lichtheimia corymbifera JMRC:FSU:9682 TaxID=1263082 RepID=A0A068SBU0_9FUNG|nr:predicted protein [Lichtheimia corymbifera JMRC:FSU:9682]
MQPVISLSLSPFSFSSMTISIDSIAVDNLRIAASQGEHNRVITDSKAISKQLLDLHLQTLDIEARSHVACAKFTQALVIAMKMQQMDPASARGYLCEGFIHMEQGRYVAAIPVYDTALERVDKHDPLYDTIQTAKAKAMQQRQKRRDIICDLPIEISDRIIQQLFTGGKFNQQREYVMVSSAWWHRIVSSNQLEYTLLNNLPTDETSNMVVASFNHTRSLTVLYCKTTLAQLFQSYHFTCLTILRLNSMYSIYTLYGLEESISALESIGTQLTKLKLSCEGYRVHPLQHLLATCPNLVSLTCEATIDISFTKDVYPNLRELELYGVLGPVDSEDMMMIREHLPSLETLDMAIEGSSRSLTMDDTWLPCIRHLKYDHRSTMNQGIYKDLNQYAQQGLASLSVADVIFPFPLNDIARIIVHHHATLQFLEFMFMLRSTDTSTIMDATHNDRHIKFTQLKTFQVFTILTSSDLDDNLHPFCDFISWVIERAPYLRTVALKDNTMNRSTLKALAKCTSLRHVELQVDNYQGPQDYDILVAEFLRDHVNHTSDKDGSRLESLTIQLNEAHPMLINAIRGLKCLTSFHLITHNLESESFKQLFTSLRQRCQDLDTLFINNTGAIRNPILYQVNSLPNLRTLTMAGDLRNAYAGILSLQRCRHLERIFHFQPIHPEVQRVLLESNPHLKIISI